MHYRPFGRKTGFQVSELILGGGMFGQAKGYGTPPEEAESILRAYAEAGGNFIDTSDAYQQGESEAAIGKFLEGRRDEFVLASKYSRTSSPQSSMAAKGAHRKTMVQFVEGSLRRLRTDRLDLYLLHVDDGITPMEEVARGFEELASAGKILYAGLSNTTPWRTAQAATISVLRGWVPLAALQVEYSLIHRDAEREFFPLAEHFGMGMMGYSPLAGGILKGKYRARLEGRLTHLPEAARHKDTGTVSQQIDTLLTIATEGRVTPGQVALAWARMKGVFPIIGPRTLDQMRDNLGSLDVKLSASDIETLESGDAIPP